MSINIRKKMRKTAKVHLNSVQKVIDALESHTITKPNPISMQAVKEAYKALYILKDFLEQAEFTSEN